MSWRCSTENTSWMHRTLCGLCPQVCIHGESHASADVHSRPIFLQTQSCHELQQLPCVNDQTRETGSRDNLPISIILGKRGLATDDLVDTFDWRTDFSSMSPRCYELILHWKEIIHQKYELRWNTLTTFEGYMILWDFQNNRSLPGGFITTGLSAEMAITLF